MFILQKSYALGIIYWYIVNKNILYMVPRKKSQSQLLYLQKKTINNNLLNDKVITYKIELLISI